jgi:HemY protein
MKKLILFIIVLIVLTLWGFDVILPDAGYLLIILGQKTLETSLWFACFILLSALLIWWLLSHVLHVSWSLAQGLTDFFVFGSTERASKRAAGGLIDFLSGDWLEARKKLLRTASKVESPLVNYLAAARSSYELGDHDEAHRILADAQKKYARFELAISLVSVKMVMADGRYDQAKPTLQKLLKQAPKNAVVIHNLLKIYEAQEDWVALNDLLPLSKKYKLGSVNETLEMESSIMVGQLQQASTLAAREIPPERIYLLRKAWAKVPSYQQKTARVVAAYAYALITHFCDQEAEVILRKTIERSWDDSLVNLYGILRTKDTAQLIRCAEDWLKHQPRNAVLLRTLGRLSLRNEIWGLARDYFQKSLAIQKNAETYAELARLLNNLGETQTSLETYQEALQLNMPSLPELPQPKKKY